MFERFTADSRAVVTHAQRIARDRGDEFIGSEHLLLALTMVADPTGTALAEHGFDTASVETRIDRVRRGAEIDPTALAGIGIDVDEIRRRVEDTFGSGALDTDPPTTGRQRRRTRPRPRHLPFTDDAKQSLHQGLQAAIQLGSRTIQTAHLALGVLACGAGTGGRMMAVAAGSGLRADLEAAAQHAA